MQIPETPSSYELIGRDPHSWLFNATPLKRAADIIRIEIDRVHTAVNHPYATVPIQDVYLFYSYYLLAGLSLENLAKGIFIGRNPQIVSNGRLNLKLLAGSSNGHDLPNLVQQMGIILTQREHDLLRRLKEFITWGKYPIHLDQNKTIHQSLSRADFLVIDGLFDKFTDILTNEAPPPSIQYV
jgi:hypothetical protein